MSYSKESIELCYWMKRMCDQSLTSISGGNISIKDEDGNYWMTPSGCDKQTLTPDIICKLDQDGNRCSGKKPTMEWKMHYLIYKERDDVRAVVHGHPTSAISFALSHTLFRTEFYQFLYTLIGNVDKCDYYICGGEDLAENCSKVLSKNPNKCSLLLYSHGILVVGKSVEDAYKKYELLECYCKMLLLYLTLSQQRKEVLVDHYESPHYSYPLIDIHTFEHPQLIPFTLQESNPLISHYITYIHRLYTNYLIHSDMFVSIQDENSLYINKPFEDPEHFSVQSIYTSPLDSLEFFLNSNPIYDSYYIHFQLHKLSSIKTIIQSFLPYTTALFLHHIPIENLMPESLVVIRKCYTLEELDQNNLINEIIKKYKEGCRVFYRKYGAILILGSSLEECYDRIEVLENTSKSLFFSHVALNSVNILSDCQINEINKAFQAKLN